MAGPLGMIGGAALQAGLGMGIGALEDARQLRQEGKLLEQQSKFDRKQAQFNQQLGLQTWEQTGPVAMTRELKEAGLNPALQYGGTGGGGQTMGNPGAAVSGGKAAKGGGEAMGMQMMDAQRQLIEAQTEKTKVETAKTAGVDTDLTREQGRMTTIAANLAAMTQEDAAEQVQARTHILWQEAKAAKGMVTAELQKKQAEAIGAQLMNDLRKVQTDMTETQMAAIGQEIAQKWKALEIQQGHLDLQKFVQDVSNSTKLTVETVARAVELVGGGFIKKIPNKMVKTHELGKSAKIEW